MQWHGGGGISEKDPEAQLKKVNMVEINTAKQFGPSWFSSFFCWIDLPKDNSLSVVIRLLSPIQFVLNFQSCHK